MSLDPYKTLGVDKKADAAAVKAAYRRLARQYHPDKNPGDQAAEEKFKKISEAYDILSDPEKKREYDSLGREAFYTRGFGGSGYQRPDFSDFSFEDIWGDLFGGARTGRRRGSFGGRAARPGRGEDLASSVSLSFREAALGTEVSLEATILQTCSACQGQGFLAAGGGVRSCPDCGGRGRVGRPQSLKAKIPAGIQEGQKIRLQGKGTPGEGGGPPGDLLVEVTVRPDPVFTRAGRDLNAELPVSLYDLLLGGTVEAPTLTGRASLKVPAGARNGARLRLKGQGLPAARQEASGDLYVTLKAVLPGKLSAEARALVERLAEAAPVTGEDR